MIKNILFTLCPNSLSQVLLGLVPSSTGGGRNVHRGRTTALLPYEGAGPSEVADRIIVLVEGFVSAPPLILSTGPHNVSVQCWQQISRTLSNGSDAYTTGQCRVG